MQAPTKPAACTSASAAAAQVPSLLLWKRPWWWSLPHGDGVAIGVKAQCIAGGVVRDNAPPRAEAEPDVYANGETGNERDASGAGAMSGDVDAAAARREVTGITSDRRGVSTTLNAASGSLVGCFVTADAADAERLVRPSKVTAARTSATGGSKYSS
mmetsp:Transcript_28389/g.81514  ORF Transcript_28389/g.81514 Transcript_28389/m.81514 type:complete len:157 (+) Transcript_28389:1169-1639(+)